MLRDLLAEQEATQELTDSSGQRLFISAQTLIKHPYMQVNDAKGHQSAVQSSEVDVSKLGVADSWHVTASI